MNDHLEHEILINIIMDNDDAEDEEMFFLQLIRNYQRNRTPRVSVGNFATAVIPRMDDIGFRSHFRVSRIAFNYILEYIGIDICPEEIPGRSRITPDKQLQIAIWHLANMQVHRLTALLYDVSMSTAWVCTFRVCEAIMLNIDNFIYWPIGEEAIEEQINMQEIAGVPNVNGIIDCTYINISTPLYFPELYANRHDDMAVKAQGVCDSRKRIIDIYAGEVGSMHDSRVLRRSPLIRKLENPLDRAAMMPNDGHMLGDSAYALTTYLLTPYRQNQLNDPIKRRYNVRHSQTRMLIENSFGLLKTRFRCLRYLYRYNIELVPLIIVTCCAIHNVCIEVNDIMDVEAEEILPVPHADVPLNEILIAQNNGENGAAKRARIARLI